MTKTEKPDHLILDAQPRTILGKSNKSHRKNGFLPANIYGKDFTSTAVSLSLSDFLSVFKQAGETSVVYIQLEGKEIPTLISDIDYHPVTEALLHVDLRKVNLKQKIEAQVPFVFIGTSEAVEKKHGVLLTQAEEVTVNALPANIPSKFEIDLAQLVEIGDSITISDLPPSSDYEIMEDPEKTIVLVTEHKEEEIEPETTAEAPEIIGETEATQGEDAPEGSGETSKEDNQE